MDYIWYSSIPKRWIEILGEDNFKPMKNRSSSFNNTIEFLRETQSYIDRISTKPLQPNSSTSNPLKFLNSIPKSSSKPPKALKPISNNLVLKSTSRRRLPSHEHLPQLKMSIKSMSSGSPYIYNNSPISNKLHKISYREDDSYTHLNRFLNPNSYSYSKLPIRREKLDLLDVKCRSGQIYKKHLMGTSLSTPKLDGIIKSGSYSSRN